MKTRVVVFYAISVLSLTLFAVSAKTNSASVQDLVPNFGIGYALIESADQLVNARY